jgi:hypothetical protein
MPQNALSAVQQTDDLATLVLSATDWRGRGTWHAWLSLAPGVASVSARLAVFNRGWSPIFVSPHICTWPSASTAIVPVRHRAERFEIGGAVGIVGAIFGYREWQLGPQSTAYLEGRILPTGLERIDEASEHAAAQIEADRLIIASADRSENNLLIVGTSAEPDRTFELKVALSPDQPTEVDLSGLPINVDRLRLRDQRGKTMLQSSAEQRAADQKLGSARSLEEVIGDDLALASCERDPGVEHAAAFARALLRMRQQDWEGALELIEDACILRGDSPIAWWARAWCVRMLDGDPSQELANAHYLAPLEPVLRADAYLSAPMDAKPGALLDGWGSNPQPFLEVADILAHAGLHEARAEWLEEARRRAPCSLIEKLLAAAHRQHGRELEAAEHLRLAAEAKDIAEPFRRSEIDAEIKL